ncbi:LysE family translocator [Pseudomonas baltica]|uniref:LysE family translocator n=1 Tax=Pseudomonas baltica TaxID=2762576 RepID=UPI0028A09AE7|nr:LysE family translocator [Pseudomonas baltica]
MIEATSLWVFAGAVVILLAVPGPNMAFVMTHGITHGWRAGLAAALGITLADMILTLLVAVGVGALIMSWAPAFDLIRGAGALYLLWLGWLAVRSRPAAASGTQVPLASLRSIFIRATLNSLLNPKALVFFMVFLPQFVTPAAGNAGVQLVTLGLCLAAIALVFHFLLGVFAGAAHRRLKHLPISRRLGSYGFAAVMVALAARMMLMARPA